MNDKTPRWCRSGLHDLSDPANRYERTDRTAPECRRCRHAAVKRFRVRKREEKAAAEKAA